MADKGQLTVGQKVKVVLLYARFAYTNGIRQGMEATVCVMGNGKEAILHITWSFYGDS
jgi:hypothetical protein